jgi:hypothetical protein|tara:strand:+ start:4198 stop:4521 length:324 start_codon:yes stop_codon:yes gene_type:complete
MATYTHVYTIFLYTIIILKILFIVLNIRLIYLKNKDTQKNLLVIQKREKYVDFIMLLFIYILILYLFWPGTDINTIKIGSHERILIFTVGIIGIVHLDWNIPKNLLF